ncbi:MAG: hypothetical protein GY940_14970 [bacterium]|nr:hypothetical protein [bacterium]
MAMTLKQRVNDLKLTLQTEEEFGMISSKFFALTEFDEFMALSKDKDDKLLESMLVKVLENIFGEPVPFALKMKYIKKFKFYHGSFISDKAPGMVMYFEGIQMGMITFTDFTGKVDYIRFTGDIMMNGGFTGHNKSSENH